MKEMKGIVGEVGGETVYMERSGGCTPPITWKVIKTKRL
jgi:hypothetical protein